MKKLIDFKDEALVKSIQDCANKNYNGNFSEAVRENVMSYENFKLEMAFFDTNFNEDMAFDIIEESCSVIRVGDLAKGNGGALDLALNAIIKMEIMKEEMLDAVRDGDCDAVNTLELQYKYASDHLTKFITYMKEECDTLPLPLC